MVSKQSDLFESEDVAVRYADTLRAAEFTAAVKQSGKAWFVEYEDDLPELTEAVADKDFDYKDLEAYTEMYSAAEVSE